MKKYVFPMLDFLCIQFGFAKTRSNPNELVTKVLLEYFITFFIHVSRSSGTYKVRTSGESVCFFF